MQTKADRPGMSVRLFRSVSGQRENDGGKSEFFGVAELFAKMKTEIKRAEQNSFSGKRKETARCNGGRPEKNNRDSRSR